jgi:hypothetical protein
VKQRVLFNEYPHVMFGATGIDFDPYASAMGAAAPTATITFHSNGTVQNPAGVYLESSVAGDTERPQAAVTMSSAGRVRIWKRGGGEWH